MAKAKPSEESGAVAFELKADVTRVEVAVQEHDETIVVTESGYTTADPARIRALDENEHVKRSDAGGQAPPPAPGDASQPGPEA